MAVGRYTRVTGDCIFDDVASIMITSSAQLYCKSGGNLSFNVAWGKLFLKQDFQEIRFPLGKLHEDEFTTWKIMFRYSEIACINTPIYAYFQRPDSIMGTWSPKRLVKINAVKEQLDWIVKNGNTEMIAKAKQKMAVVYAEEIRSMTRYGMSSQIVREYRMELRRHIKNTRKELPLFRYKAAYEMAWPIETRTICFIRSLLSKVKYTAISITEIGKSNHT